MRRKWRLEMWERRGNVSEIFRSSPFFIEFNSIKTKMIDTHFASLSFFFPLDEVSLFALL